MENSLQIKNEGIVMKKENKLYLRWYRMEYFDCDNGLYKFAIYDNEGHIQDPNIYKDCDVKGSMAVNLTWGDVQEFFTLIKGGNYGK